MPPNDPANTPQRNPLAIYPGDAAAKPGLAGPQKGALAVLVGTLAAGILGVMVPREEGMEYVGYLDIAGIPTACAGDTKNVRVGQRYSLEECRTRLERQLVSHAKGALECVPTLRAEARDYQRAAVVSFAYNVGVGGFCRSTAARKFRAKDWKGGCDALLPWDKARVNGVLRPVKGLTARRQREWALCRTGL